MIFGWNSDKYNYTSDLKLPDDMCNKVVFNTSSKYSILSIDMIFSKEFLSIMRDINIFNYITVFGTSHKIIETDMYTRLACFPCYIEDIILETRNFNKFYFYLLIDTSISMTLLGNDFIRHCSMSKDIDSNIEITDFDFESYERNFIDNIDGDVIFPIHSIYEEYKRIESTKNLTSAFQYLVTHPKKV